MENTQLGKTPSNTINTRKGKIRKERPRPQGEKKKRRGRLAKTRQVRDLVRVRGLVSRERWCTMSNLEEQVEYDEKSIFLFKLLAVGIISFHRPKLIEEKFRYHLVSLSC
ncbi:hypothetical protein ACLOJK_012684 [Asimina triloba]